MDPLRARKLLPDLSAEQVTEALTQARHRPAGFPLQLVTPTGIQQASPIPVAQRRAARLAASGVTTVVDAGCGIGVDSWALARAGLHVIAYEIDPVTAQVARANLAGLDVEVREADATTEDLPDGILFVDPARRREHSDASGQALRVHDPSQWRPSWDWVLEQAAAPSGCGTHPPRAPGSAGQDRVALHLDATSPGGCDGLVRRPGKHRSRGQRP